MDRYELPELQRQYFSHSQYSPPIPSPSDHIVNWPDRYHTLTREKPFLDEMLENPDYAQLSLTDRVFGRQIKHGGLSTRRLAQLLYERCTLHYSHMGEINHRHMKCQEDLFLAKLHQQDDNGRHLSNLERLLVQLESDKRREENQFWQDTLDLRQTMFDKAQDYATAKDRAAILQPFSLGGTYDLV